MRKRTSASVAAGDSGIAILVVGDDQAMRHAKVRILTEAGFVVHEAQTGKEALQLLVAQHPELVLLDVKLPDVDGMEVCARIKANPDTSHVMVMQTSAALVEGNDRVRALEGGADTYLIEPAEPEELLANVRAMLRLRRAEETVRTNERLLRLGASAAKLDYWSIDLAGRPAPSAAQFAGMCKLPAGTNVRLHPDDVAALESTLAAALAGRTDYDVQYRIVDERGAISWIGSQAMVVRDASGHPLQIIGVGLDITERKHAEREREDLLEREQAARVEAQEAKHLKDEFLAVVSHELRTPLNAIIGWIHLLRTGQLDAGASARAVESIERSAQSQSQLINDLLDVSRIISGKLRLNVSSIAPVAVVEVAIDTVRPAAQAKGIRLNVDLDRSIGSTAADPDRLQQIVWNLLTNAIKFCGKDGNVGVRVQRAGSDIELVVDDDGAGIDAKFLPYIFHPFRQADASSTRRYPGLGLGLAIARQLVELHGGRVHASSPGPGKGSTFTVTLPIRTPGAREDAPGSRKGLHMIGTIAPETAPDLSGVTVLVVDDDEDAREILATSLAQAGASVAKAASATAALAYFDHTLPAVLLSDIGMPDQDGYMFIKSLRNRPAERGGRVPAIALTAYARSDDRFRALASGFQIHIAKPVDVNELLSVVASLAGRKV